MQGIYHEHSNLSKGPKHDISVFIAYAQKTHLNAHADVFSGVRGLNFCLSLHLHPYFVNASGEDSDETAHMRRLV